MKRLLCLAPALTLVLLIACGRVAAPSSSIPASEVPSAPAISLPEPVPEPVTRPAAEIFYPLPEEVMARITDVSFIEGSPIALSELTYLRLPYVDLAGDEHTGEMIVHYSLAGEVADIFTELFEAGWPIAGMALVDEYGADDLASMAANNSYAFCARRILGTESWSVHSYGAAIDLNPVQNPYITGGSVYPEAAKDYLDRTDLRPGMVMEGDLCYNAFVSRGWSWGGHWQNPDYQHFEKPL